MVEAAMDSDVVLVVDDVPENLSVLHDVLDEAGYRVLVATDGETAIQRARQGAPQVILLDAMMPEMDGFEVCRRLRSDLSTQQIPVIFMTGLTETEHVVAAFDAGGTDYVTKPIKPLEVLARIVSHLRRARVAAQARAALDACGQATIAVSITDGSLAWQTPLARELLEDFFGNAQRTPAPILSWVGHGRPSAALDPGGISGAVMPLNLSFGARRLVVLPAARTGQGEWLLTLREESDDRQAKALVAAFRLTQREAEVLHWVMLGKTSRDVADILGSSPRTVDKHLEHIFAKLGVETRTAAVSLASEMLRHKAP